jgi:phage terminase small subunit
MTDKQKRFADEYLIDCNATRAYKAAYPNVKNDSVASAAGTRLLGKVKVKEYIDEKMDQISSNKIADVTEVMEYLTSVMRGEIKDETLRFVGDGYQEKIKLQVGAKDRTKAAELLGKRYGIWTEKIGLEGVIPVVISGDDQLEE